ncbi:hypothetical protein [Luteitalea sp.]
MPISGKDAIFKLHNGGTPGSITDISEYIRSIETNNESEEIDGTTLRKPKRVRVSTFEADSFTITFAWSPAASAFIRGIKGKQNLAYEYGPEGDEVGMEKIEGTVNVLRAQDIPPANPDNLTEVTVELSINTATFDTYAA